MRFSFEKKIQQKSVNIFATSWFEMFDFVSSQCLCVYNDIEFNSFNNKNESASFVFVIKFFGIKMWYELSLGVILSILMAARIYGFVN